MKIRMVMLVALIATSSFGADKPNVVVILADDLGYTDLGCHGSRYYETPNIDRLAEQGVRFTDGYTCGPNCQPTRAALMSGQYGPRTGVYTVGSINRFSWKARGWKPVENATQLRPDIVTVAEAMKAAGYATGMFGKWHLGEDADHHPLAQGFDEAIVTMGKHYKFATFPKTPYDNKTYLADFLTEKAVDYIDRHHDKPFFLYLSHFGVHSPYQAKDNLIAKFKPKAGVGGHNDPTYAAMIASVDESVGRVVKALDTHGLGENTLVIFTSDNGGVGGYQREGIKGRDVTDNAPLRGGKGMLYEGGIRVPYIFRWTGTTAPGTNSAEPITSVDLYPTLVDLAGGKLPSGQAVDGVSYLPLLKPGGQKSLTREAIYWHFPGYLGSQQNTWRATPVGVIRAGDWKLHEFFEDGHVELYNLRTDIGERTDLATENPEKVAELKGKLIAWRNAVGAKLPTRLSANKP